MARPEHPFHRFNIDRRHFLGIGAATAASALTRRLRAEESKPDKEKSANSGTKADANREPVRVAVMGVHGRGRQLLSSFMSFPEVEIAYICDPDANALPPAVKMVTDKDRPAPQTISDFRRALDDKNVDVLICAAPDHWHALSTVLACQAGKDVYVEKPVSHNIVEGRRMIEAARKYNRVVQAGTQRRSSEDMVSAVEQVRGGKLGKVHFARTWITSVRPSIGKVAVSAPPSNLDFDLWAGPAVDPQYKKNLVHYHWHWRWLYGTGECGNNGIHALDVARWGLGVDAPELVTCGGNKYFFDDDQETPDTQIATFDFADAVIQWEHRTWTKEGIDGADFGVVFYGTEASLVVTGNGWKIVQGNKVVEENAGAGRSSWELSHVRNFLDCRISREKPAADIEIGHLSTRLCHLANIAWRTRSTVKFDGKNETILDNPAAVELQGREYRHGYELPTIA